MKILPKISIVIPVYNVEEYISECLHSLMRQTYKGEMECILVDDCGMDQSVEIVEQLINAYSGGITFRIVHHEHNRGLSAARNIGTEVATGDYIYYLDSDDYISDDCFEVLTKPLRERDFDIVLGDYKMFGDKNDLSLLLEQRESIIGNKEIFSAYADRQIYVMAWNKLCKLSFLRDNAIDFLEGQLHEDELWMYKIVLQVQSISIVHQVTYFYRVRANSIATSQSKLQMKFTSYADTVQYIQSHPFHGEDEYYKCLMTYWNLLISFAFQGHNNKRTYVQLRKTCLYNPWKLLKQHKLSIAQFKKRLHFALPPNIGYAYLKIRYLKNNI